MQAFDSRNFSGLQMLVDEDMQFNIIGMAPHTERFIAPKQGGGKAKPTAYHLAKFGMEGPLPVASFPIVRGSKYDLYSDKRLKQNIKDIAEGDLEKLKELKRVEYQLKEFPGEKHYGFIAQDVEKVYPELVTTGADTIKSLDYTQFIPLLAEANNRLKEELEATKERIKKLERRNML